MRRVPRGNAYGQCDLPRAVELKVESVFDRVGHTYMAALEVATVRTVRAAMREATKDLS